MRKHITHNLSTEVDGNDLVIFLDMAGIQMIETLTPAQVCNLFLDWLSQLDPHSRSYSLNRLEQHKWDTKRTA